MKNKAVWYIKLSKNIIKSGLFWYIGYFHGDDL